VKYLLDTNAVSALLRGDPEMLARLRSVPRDEIAIPQPALAELAYGIARLPASRRRDRLAERVTLVCEEIARAQWTDEVSRRFGELKALLERGGERLEDFDVAMAAHALALGAILVTANVEHLGRVRGLRIEDWGR